MEMQTFPGFRDEEKGKQVFSVAKIGFWVVDVSRPVVTVQGTGLGLRDVTMRPGEAGGRAAFSPLKSSPGWCGEMALSRHPRPGPAAPPQKHPGWEGRGCIHAVLPF